MNDIICPMCNTCADYKIKDEVGAYCYCSFVVEIEDRKVDSVVKMLEDRVNRLDQIRPESYKSVADTADFRIRIYRHIIKLINDEQSNEPER
jgi:hypothetical protein